MRPSRGRRDRAHPPGYYYGAYSESSPTTHIVASLGSRTALCGAQTPRTFYSPGGTNVCPNCAQYARHLGPMP
jgi:hypothetical protein